MVTAVKIPLQKINRKKNIQNFKCYMVKNIVFDLIGTALFNTVK